MSEHAILPPSSAKMWLTCTRSVRAAANLPAKSSKWADEGTLAHQLGELLITWKLRRVSEKVYKKKLLQITKNEHYSESMLDYCEEYAAYVIGRYNAVRKKHRSAIIMTETRVDMSPWVPEGFGTADVIIMATGYLEFIDLKFGQGVPVYAEKNEQLMLYALGVINDYDFIFAFGEIVLRIYQPRIDNISSYETTHHELTYWGDMFVKPRAQQAFDGKGSFVPGDHCQFCPIKHSCRANATFRMNLSGAFKEPDKLTDKEIAEVLTKYSGLVNWAGAVEEYALQQALAGKSFPGFKLVAGRSTRFFTDKEAVAKTLSKAGFKPDQYIATSLLSLAAIERELGVKDFNYHLHKLVKKPYGKPSLVSASDPKPPYDKLREAKEVFGFE